MGELQCDYCHREISIKEPYRIISEKITVVGDFYLKEPSLYQRVICNKCHKKRLKQTILLFGSLFLITACLLTILVPFGFIVGIFILILGGVWLIFHLKYKPKKEIPLEK